MTTEQWETELTAVLADSGWIARWPGVSQDGSTCFADLHHVSAQQTRQVLMRFERFMTAEARRTEILRRISNLPTTERLVVSQFGGPVLERR